MRLALWLLLASALAACAQLSGFEDGELRPEDAAAVTIDAAPDTDAATADEPALTDRFGDPLEAPPVCDPILQLGCAADEKCTWIRIQSTPERIGKLGCVPEGTVPLDGTCTLGPEGETTGYDNCAPGGLCINGRCRDICGFDNSVPGSQCALGEQCTRYAHTFEDENGTRYAGACNAVCDPITQRQLEPGSPPCPAGEGCYLISYSDDSMAICAPAGTVGHNEDIDGLTYANSCVPGAMPRAKEHDSPVAQCGGLCRPAPVTSTMNMTLEGGVTTADIGDMDNCQSRWGAAAPGNADGESCRYYYARESFQYLSPYSNSVGWCFKHSRFLFDSDGDGVPETTFPRCTQVTEGDVIPPVDDPAFSDALYFFCVPHPGPATLRAAIISVRDWVARREASLTPDFDPR